MECCAELTETEVFKKQKNAHTGICESQDKRSKSGDYQWRELPQDDSDITMMFPPKIPYNWMNQLNFGHAVPKQWPDTSN